MKRTTKITYSHIGLKAGKYLFSLSLPLTTFLSHLYLGYFTFLPLFYSFCIIPLIELFIKQDRVNYQKEEEELLKNHPIFDYIIYSTVIIHYFLLFSFLQIISSQELTQLELIGLISGMGVMCGVYGINVGHELGHRKKKEERLLAKIALLSSLYLHFFIEHNRGHHKRVSTEEDPASARKYESIYAFWLRSVYFSYLSAWKLEFHRLKNRDIPIWSWQNEMLRFQIYQFIWLMAIGLIFGWFVLPYYFASAVMGILLLETVNYIEHYGLTRKKISAHSYERVLPHHSWNSNHVLGRLVLFELSRHSDHHYVASRKYQILRHHEDTPQMPTGYPGMMLLSLIPPLWFNIMHKKLAKLQSSLK